MRKLLLILLTVFLCSCSTINYQRGFYGDRDKKPIYIHSFSDKSQLPYKLIISDQYLQSKDRIFMVNQNWISTYSRLVEYDLSNSTIVKEIASFESKNENISETINDNAYIVFVVNKLNEKNKFKDIYLYNIENGDKTLIKSDIFTGLKDEFSADLFVTIYNNSVYWINPDFENKKSAIMSYNITDHTIKQIHEQAFLEKGFMSHIPSTFLTLSGNCLVFNNRTNEDKEKIVFFDLNSNSIVKKIEIPTEFVFNYYAVSDNKEECLYIYGRTKDNEMIYRLNMQTQTVQKLVGFMERTYLIKNRIYYSDDQLFYSVNQNFTGNIRDHYFSEIYNLINYKMVRYQYRYNSVKTDRYFAFLEFDEKEGPDIMKMEIYQLK